MPRLLHRRLRCFYCNGSAYFQHNELVEEWTCPNCEAVNHVDQHGRIIDPPPMETTPNRPPHIQYARERSPPALTMQPSTQSPFCDTCQRNHVIVTEAMASYLPDEDDPTYPKYLASADAHRRALERRYPLVCEKCIGKVRDQVRAAGYAARTDNLRRILENSKQYKLIYCTPKQRWILRAVTVGKVLYFCSLGLGLLWHALCATSGPKGSSKVVDCWISMRANVWLDQQLDVSRITGLVPLALAIDLVTIWWNPHLRLKIARPGGKMKGLKPLWIVRLLVLAARLYTYLHWRDTPSTPDTFLHFHIAHICSLAAVLTSLLATHTLITVKSHPPTALMQPIEPYLPTLPTSDTPYPQPTRPDPTPFDTMAESFTSTYQETTPALPPSPTLTTATTTSLSTTRYTSTTAAARTPKPRGRREPTPSDDAMDWTPTTRRRRSVTPSIPIEPRPRHWNRDPSPPAPKQPHSLFPAAPPHDPSPFRRQPPAFPRGNTQKPSPWATTVNTAAHQQNSQQRFSPRTNVFRANAVEEEEKRRLQEAVVPKGRKREEEVFRKPQLKYEWEGLVRGRDAGIGIEERFNSMFSFSADE
ncbi:hypothetical protein M011DRAFT_478813 [Sporormia fimetaria CBS 119925]|uniref:Ima1 N-terminal domain-containing protein n=1 Tax=Sporormia fimetaria CBS 119925 TaxID=1340428 RepID=A0A6A6V518_9PLEO|nr:hypothetical protein M011DRAFT_478813 [Sporormia fimetaria CBS 119925]